MKKVIIIVVLMFVISGCDSNLVSELEEVLVVYSPHPLEFIDPIIDEFESETNIIVNVISAGTGELLNRIENEIDEPLGDILWGGSLSTLQSKKTLFQPYYSINEEAALFKNEQGYITRFTLVPSIIMVNKNLIGDIKVEGYEDLLQPELKGRIAFADPATSSSSYEQLLNQLWAFKEGNVWDSFSYVEQLIINLDGHLLDRSRDVYTGVADGEYFVGLTFEEPAAKYVQTGAPIEIVYPIEGTIVRPDGVAIINNAKHSDEAKAFIDFVTSYEIQRFIALELNRRSIRTDVEVNDGLKSLDDILLIEDDQQWSSKNKNKIIEEFKRLFNGED